MNKSELVDKLAKRVQLSKSQSEEVLDAALEIIQGAVIKGDEVKLMGFGTFTRCSRKSRVARNPKTGLKVQVPAGDVPRFRPGKEFREKVRS